MQRVAVVVACVVDEWGEPSERIVAVRETTY